MHGQHRDQPPIAHVHGSRNPITRFLRRSSPRDARRPLSLSLSLCPREGNRSAPIRRVCSVKSTRPRGEGPRGGKQDSCFSTDFSASSVTRERSPLFCKRDEEKSNLFRILLLFDKYVGEQIRDTITIAFLFFFLSDSCCVVFRRIFALFGFVLLQNNIARIRNGIRRESKRCCTEHYQNDAKQSRICATRSGTISIQIDLCNFLLG